MVFLRNSRRVSVLDINTKISTYPLPFIFNSNPILLGHKISYEPNHFINTSLQNYKTQSLKIAAVKINIPSY